MSGKKTTGVLAWEKAPDFSGAYRWSCRDSNHRPQTMQVKGPFKNHARKQFP